jgi:2-polyprenyl-6-methoxyphenol hydroxylase-like FAD-dependent oxidoreductase
MTRTATVVGAGIAGPVAALTLQQAGWSVTVHEQNTASHAGSVHMITLDEDVVSAMRRLGVNTTELYKSGPISVEAYEDGDLAMRVTQPPPARWDDVHHALSRHCDITYGSRVTSQPDTDIVVWADGIGSYGRDSLTHTAGGYGGEMLFRGLLPRAEHDMAWQIHNGRLDQTWSCVTYATWDSMGNPVRGWTLFLPMEREAWADTETLTAGQRSRLAAYCAGVVTDTVAQFIARSTEITAAPQIVWPPADGRMLDVEGGQRNYIIGDAAGTVSPKTGEGANVAIREASTLTLPPQRWETKAEHALDDLLAQSRLSGLHG